MILAAIAVLHLIFLDHPTQAQTQDTTSITFTNGAGVSDIQPGLNLVIRDTHNALLDRQSVVKLDDIARKNTLWQATAANSRTSFHDLAAGEYDLEVSAVGYLPQHKHVQIAFEKQDLVVDIQLERDPDAIELDTSNDVIPAKYRNDTKRVLYSLKSGKLAEARKQLDKVQIRSGQRATQLLIWIFVFRPERFRKIRILPEPGRCTGSPPRAAAQPSRKSAASTPP